MFYQEVSQYDFGDKRLWNRFLKVYEEICTNMSSIITVCFSTKASREGAYRFFSNKKVSAQIILATHTPVLKQRAKETGDVKLIIHDTSTFSYPSHPCTKNLGRVGKRSQPGYGLNVHTSLCINAVKNKPLGVVHQSYFFHTDETKTQNRLIEEKESYRWVEHLEKSNAVCPGAIHICDREGDIFEFFQKAEEINAKFIVRQTQDRRLGESAYGNGEGCISDNLKETEIAGTYDAVINEEVVTLSLKYNQLKLAPPRRSVKQRGERIYKYLIINIVQVCGTAKDGAEISWNLLTDLSVKNFEEARLIVEYYIQRWNIELFHKALKSGFSLEEARLEDGEKLQSLIALISIEAARVYSVLYSIRDPNPPEPTEYFSSEELKIIEVLMKRNKNQNNQTSLTAIVEFIAIQGGFSKTKKYPYPGILTFFRGWQKIMSQIEAIKLVWNR